MNYKQLPKPNDSEFDRKSLFNYLPIFLSILINNVLRLIRWSPIIWHDRDWGYWHLLEILKKKLEFQREHIVNMNRYESVNIKNKYMTICLNLIERVQNDYYELEYIDKNLDNYLNKYKSTVRYIKSHLNRKGNCQFNIIISEKEGLAFSVALHNHKKANDLLFKILRDKLYEWND